MQNVLEKKILIIDDSEADQEIMKRFLSKTGYQNIFTASNAADGIHLARTEKPALIILDIVMPQKDGAQTAKLLSQDSVTKDIPIIFVTSLVRDGEMQGGSTRVFGKPFNIEELAKKIEKVFSEMPEDAA
jgi:CheY-like chemotaxis protein